MFEIRKMLLVCLLLVGMCLADTVYVSGPTDPCGMGSQHLLIQDAVDAADIGDTIIVCPKAAYTENILINKSVHLRSENKGESVIVRAASASIPVLSIEADHVSISDFTLMNATGSYGLFSTGSFGDFKDIGAFNNDIGFYLSGSSNNNLTSNTAGDNLDEGFRLYAGSNNNTLVGNTAYNQVYYGFYLYDSSYNKLISNTAFNSTSWYGFFLYFGATENALVNNTAFGNGHHGFHIFMNSNNSLGGNVAYNNSADGFRISSSSSNHLRNNTAYNNSADGFRLLASNGNLLEGNLAHKNLMSGFLVSSSSQNVISENSAYKNSLYGFHLHLGAKNNISSNDAFMQEDGFHLYGSSENILYSNDAHENENGFYMDTSYFNQLISNTAHANNVYGFLFSSSSDNNISGNDAYGNLKHGFYNYLSSNYFEKNTAHDNLNGYMISTSSDNRIVNNTAYSNLNNGFYLYISSGNEVINNYAYGNLQNGFYLYESPGNAISGNTATGNGKNGFYIYLSPKNNFFENLAHLNGGTGFLLLSSPQSAMEGNVAYGNLLHGIHVLESPLLQSSGNTAHSNQGAGCFMESSGNSVLEDDHYFNNSIELWIGSPDSSMYIIASGIIIDNPSGSFKGYTNLSISDRILPGSAYWIRWVEAPDELPYPYTSFEDKFLEIAAESGGVSIDEVTWHWLDSESPGYNESGFSVWQYDSLGWLEIKGDPNTSSNNLYVADLVPMSKYGLLQKLTLPTFTIYGPEDGGIVNSTTANLSWSVLSVDPTANCTLTVNSESVLNITTQGGERNDNLVPLPEDSYQWNVTCQDSMGTNSSQTIGFTVDLPPSVVLESPDQEYTNSSDYGLGFTVYDNSSLSMNCTLLIDGVINQSKIASNSTPDSFPASGLSEGSHELQVFCEDESGNTGVSEEKEVISDQTPPQVSLIFPPDGYHGDESVVEFSVNATDELSPTLNYTLYIDGNPNQSGANPFFSVDIPEGDHDWSVLVTDMAGNQNHSETWVFTIDQSAPAVEITDPEGDDLIIGSAPGNATIVFNASDEGSSVLDCSLYLDDALVQENESVAGQGSFDLIGIPEGIHSAYIECSDEAGNSGSSGTITIVVDGTPPHLELISPENGYVGNDVVVDFVFNATDNLSENLTSYLFIDGTLENSTTSNSVSFALDEGEHAWWIVSADEAGNYNVSEARNITIDQSAPQIVINAPPNPETIVSDQQVDITFKFTVMDNLAASMNCTSVRNGVLDFNGDVGNGSTASFIKSIGIGTFSWIVECRDTAGNIGQSPYQSLTIRSSSPVPGGGDSDPDPVIDISHTQNCPENTVTFSVSSGGDTELRLVGPDGLLSDTATSDSSGLATLPIEKEGRYFVRAKKPSYQAGSLYFDYAMCQVAPPTSGDDDSDEGGSGGDTAGNQTGEQNQTDGSDGEVQLSEPNDPDPPEEDPVLPDVEIIVDDTAYQGDDVAVLVRVGNMGMQVPLTLRTPGNKQQLIITDISGKTSFRADKIGIYNVSIALPELPKRNAIVNVIKKEIESGEISLPPLLFCFFFLPLFLLLLLVILALLSRLKSKKRKKMDNSRYKGFKSKKGGSKIRIGLPPIFG